MNHQLRYNEFRFEFHGGENYTHEVHEFRQVLVREG